MSPRYKQQLAHASASSAVHVMSGHRAAREADALVRASRERLARSLELLVETAQAGRDGQL